MTSNIIVFSGLWLFCGLLVFFIPTRSVSLLHRIISVVCFAAFVTTAASACQTSMDCCRIACDIRIVVTCRDCL